MNKTAVEDNVLMWGSLVSILVQLECVKLSACWIISVIPCWNLWRSDQMKDLSWAEQLSSWGKSGPDQLSPRPILGQLCFSFYFLTRGCLDAEWSRAAHGCRGNAAPLATGSRDVFEMVCVHRLQTAHHTASCLKYPRSYLILSSLAKSAFLFTQLEEEKRRGWALQLQKKLFAFGFNWKDV